MWVWAEPFDTEQDNGTAILFGCDACSEFGDFTSVEKDVAEFISKIACGHVQKLWSVCLLPALRAPRFFSGIQNICGCRSRHELHIYICMSLLTDWSAFPMSAHVHPVTISITVWLQLSMPCWRARLSIYLQMYVLYLAIGQGRVVAADQSPVPEYTHERELLLQAAYMHIAL